MGSIEGAQKVCADMLRATELNKLENEEFAQRSSACSGFLMAPAEPSWLNPLTPTP